MSVGERFQVRSITGYSYSPVPGEGKRSTTWWVADTAYCWREVSLWARNRERRVRKSGKVYERDHPKPTGLKLTHRRSIAEFTAAYLNAAHEREDVQATRSAEPS